MANPDGYEYSRNYDRNWRKNRNTANCDCYDFTAMYWYCNDHCGVDLNRNWGHKWNTGGSSNNPCDHEQYHGTGPFSEAETRNIKNYLEGKDF